MTEKLSGVCREAGKSNRVVHINSTKMFQQRSVAVNSVCIVAKNNKEMSEIWNFGS